jgi:hypothetical protein
MGNFLKTCYKQIVFSHIKKKNLENLLQADRVYSHIKRKKVWLSENNPRGGPSAWVAQEEAFFF